MLTRLRGIKLQQAVRRLEVVPLAENGNEDEKEYLKAEAGEVVKTIEEPRKEQTDPSETSESEA